MTEPILDPQTLLDDALSAGRLGIQVTGPYPRLYKAARAMEHIRARERKKYRRIVISLTGTTLRVIDGGKMEDMIR